MKDKKILYNKIIKNIIPVLFMVILSIIVLDFAYTLVYSKKDITKILLYNSNQEKWKIENILKKYKELISSMCEDIQFTDPQISLVSRAEKAIPYQKNFNLEMIGISDENGKSTSTFNKEIGNISERKYFKKAICKRKMIISSLIYAKANGKKIYVVCKPFFNKENKIIGTIHGSIKFKEVQKMLYNKNDVIYSAIVDENYKIIAHSLKKNISEKNNAIIFEHFLGINENEILFNFKNKIPGIYYSYSLKKIGVYIVSYNFIEDTNWIILTKINILKYINNIFLIFIIKCLCTMLIFILIANYLKKKVLEETKSVDKFLYEASNYSNEDLKNENSLDKILIDSAIGFEDPLTKTLRKEIFIKNVKNILEKNKDEMSLILFVDLDNLKKVNDTLGHEYGDRVITLFSEKLKFFLKNFDFKIGRYGGDEFIVFIKNASLKDIDFIRKNINKALKGKIRTNYVSINYSASVGASIYPTHSKDIESLIDKADKAVYSSKKKGRDSFTLY